MVDQHPFFLEALTQVDNNTFLFQQHLKATFDLLRPLARVCLPPFELVGQQMVQLQNSILEHLHHHTFSNMLPTQYLKPNVLGFYHVLAQR
jgi:hypothetical protein